MCGIAGMLRFDQKPAEHSVIRRMTDRIAHRGPDADGFYVEGPLALGHRRLSIIDLSVAANQPIADNSGRYQIIFNGEIYNFRDVKQQLPDYDFKTNGDTEVILAAYSKWGANCLPYLKGMFIIIIWDTIEKELFIARDRMGVKPLYYYKDENYLLFASEIRGILSSGLVTPAINKEAVADFLSFQSVGGDLSIINNIFQLPAASYISVKDKKMSVKKYWNITDREINFDFNDAVSVKKQVRTLLSKSVERRLISDVPLGAFLSGGIDSSAVVGLMAEVSSARPNTFTIGFEEKEFDETPYADIIAKKFNTIHNRVLLKPSVFLAELENALLAMDTPSGDGVNTYVVSKEIRQSGVTVALSGMGGDELFAGYPFFNQYLRLKKFENAWGLLKGIRYAAAGLYSLNDSNKSGRIQQLLKAPTNSINYFYPPFRQIMGPALLSKLTRLEGKASIVEKELTAMQDAINKFPLLSQVSIADYTGYTQHTLLKDTDQMSMASSLEVREPFFDHDLVSFVLGIPDNIKKGTYSKSLLVESLNGLLPDEIVHRKKQGFLFPWSVWMKNELKDFCEQHIQRMAQREFINGNELIAYWKRFLKNDKQVRWMELWLFVILENWMEKNNV